VSDTLPARGPDVCADACPAVIFRVARTLSREPSPYLARAFPTQTAQFPGHQPPRRKREWDGSRLPRRPQSRSSCSGWSRALPSSERRCGYPAPSALMTLLHSPSTLSPPPTACDILAAVETIHPSSQPTGEPANQTFKPRHICGDPA
jgi:hypothetical protein